jgi:hypothetical protein
MLYTWGWEGNSYVACGGSFRRILYSANPLSGVAVQARQSAQAGTVSILCSQRAGIATPLSWLE